MLAFLEKMREQHKDDDEVLVAINEVENEINEKKYGLVWEEHSEEVEERMVDEVPIFVEDKDKEITMTDNGYNFLLEGTHISHDTVVGDHCVFGYGTKIAGDCEIGNGVIFSSGAIQNANTRAGRLSLIQAGCAFSHDVPPFVIAGGNPMTYGGPNTTMMKLAGIDEKVQKHIANAYRLLFHGKTSVFDVINQIRDQVPDGPEIQTIITFLEHTKRGIMCK